jgi:hypothetical protein
MIDKDKTTKSLEELGYLVSEQSDSISSLTEKVLYLSNKPINTFSIEDLRILIGQNIALEILIPIAITKLEENPFVSGDYYYGDLLQSVLSIPKQFWKNHQDLYFQLAEIIGGLPEILEDIKSSIVAFDNLQ